MAAPAVAGVIALVLGEALARNLQLTADGIRDIVMSTARRAPPDGAGWDDRFGNGRIDAAAAVRAVIERPGGPPEAAVAVASSPSATPPRRRQARAARPRRGRNVA
jgi:subtilisin family serine protease